MRRPRQRERSDGWLVASAHNVTYLGHSWITSFLFFDPMGTTSVEPITGTSRFPRIVDSKPIIPENGVV